jgi:hypothetical protein
MTNTDTKVFRNVAAILRTRTGLNIAKLAYVKGTWKLGKDKVEVNGTQWVARVDWTLTGWAKWWDGRIVDYRIGYIADNFQPPLREELGDHDKEQWEVWNRGRDPWELSWSLPLFNQVSNEQCLWSTDTVGGKDALGALLVAYADRVDSAPTDGKVLPIVQLGTDSYDHGTRGIIAIPILDILGWATAPNTPRPPLPRAQPPKELPAPDPFDTDSIPF